jgi:ADP-ribose pyrophosphatase
VSAKLWTPLGLYYPAPGLFTEIIHLYLARDLTVGRSKPDVDEELELQWVPFGEAMDKILSGAWNDGKTAMAMLRAQSHLQL